MKKQITKPLLKILVAALLTLAVYFLLNSIWRALLNELSENSTLQMLLLSTMVSAAYGFALLLLVKIRRGAGTAELLADYKEREYVSLSDDLKTVWQHERLYICLLGAVILSCLVLNKFDALIIGHKTVSVITLPFLSLCIFSTCFAEALDFLGYFISFGTVSTFYLLFVALYRRKQARIWLKKGTS